MQPARPPSRHPGLRAIQPVARRLALVVALFVAIVVCLLGLVHAQMGVLAGVRAYVGGEGLWSKGQKDAVHQLVRYAKSHDEADYEAYRRALTIPAGDRRARRELEQPQPDMRVVYDGFVQGQNHPDDVPDMARLFRRFRQVSYIDKAIGIWAAADRYIAAIERLGNELHAEMATGKPDARHVARIVGELDPLNDRLTTLERAFSSTLGKGARHAKRLMLTATYVITALLVSIGILVSWTMVRHLHGWETKYRRLLETATDAILVADRETGIVLQANHRAAALIGVPLERLIGRRQPDLFSDRDAYRRLFDEQLVSAGAAAGELRVRNVDGRTIPVEISAGTTELMGTTVVHAILRDVTERQRAEQDRAELLAREQIARAEAEHANRAKDEFLATLSHELRTPLAAILIWSRLLRTGRIDEPKRARALEVIERNTKLQAQLIEDLLDVSRIVTGKLRLDFGLVELPSVVDAGIDSVRSVAEAKGVRLTTDLDTGVPSVVGDRNRLQQIVWNLVTNAIKFTPAGGEVSVRLARVGRSAVLTVRDTGIGIAPAFLPHLFQRFQQADGTSTRAHAGLGLGLAIVRHLVEQHTGTVTASSPGETLGATFTVTLPLAVEPCADRGDHPAIDNGREARALAGLQILVIDDEPDARESIALVLEQSGAHVTMARSAREGLAAVERHHPDLVLCDLGMPGEDGYAFMRALGDRGDAPPTAALTAYALADDRRRVLDAGFRAHLAKPVDPIELIRAVAALAAGSPRPADAVSSAS